MRHVARKLLKPSFEGPSALPRIRVRTLNNAQNQARSQDRARFYSSKTLQDTPASSRSRQQYLTATLIALSLTSAGFGYYHLKSRNPLALETSDTFRKRISSTGGADIKALSVWVPYRAEDVDDFLLTRELVFEPRLSHGILRVDLTEIESNHPMEDALSDLAGWTDCGGKFVYSLGVYDGHWGGETALVLRHWLPTYVIRAINDARERLYPEVGRQTADPPADLTSSEIDQAIRDAFLLLDQNIIEGGAKTIEGDRFLNDAMTELAPSYSGACALFALYDTVENSLKVACTGDSRAILGRRNAKGEYEAIPLSTDQNGYNEEEIARIHAEHPDEPDAVKDGRLLGLAVTRAFGDGIWKWSKDLQEKARARFFGRYPRPGLKTPPYLTAEPVITTTQIYPENGDFLIMASDGLWDQLTSEQAVDLVGRWLKSYDPSAIPPRLSPPRRGDDDPWYGQDKERIRDNQRMESRRRGHPPKDMAYTEQVYADEKNYVVEDANAATHLARNALGGGNQDLIRGLLTVPPPYSRNLRDDISVQVVFFGNKKIVEKPPPEVEPYDLDNEE